MLRALSQIDFSDALAPVELAILILSYALLVLVALPVHEWAHALAAYKLGDETAKWNGRLTLNPFKHLDLFGTAMLVLCGVGYAKPVPVNPFNFRNSKKGMAITSLAGPLSNLVMAVLSTVCIRVLILLPTSPIATALVDVFYIFASINISLTVFNLLPIPPLDGSNIFGAILPDKWTYAMQRYERYITIGLFACLLLGVLDGPLDLLHRGFGFVICKLLGMPNIFA